MIKKFLNFLDSADNKLHEYAWPEIDNDELRKDRIRCKKYEEILRANEIQEGDEETYDEPWNDDDHDIIWWRLQRICLIQDDIVWNNKDKQSFPKTGYYWTANTFWMYSI